MNYENPSIQSIGEDEVIEPLSASVKDVIISTPIKSNLLDPSNGCHQRSRLPIQIYVES